MNPNKGMTDAQEETVGLYAALTARALNEEQSKFELLTTASAWLVAHKAKVAVKKVIKMYHRLIKELYKAYNKQILIDTTDSDFILLIRENLICLNFYKQEYAILKDMLWEYWTYVNYGHFCEQWLLARERSAEDMWDYRGDEPNGK